MASYPRSGSSLLRMALHYCYGLKTGSVYNEGDLPDYCVEHFNSSAECEGWIKTHGTPAVELDVPCIVMVRDPRRVFLSLQRFYRERNGLEYSIDQVIDGRHLWGDWSEWIRAWAARAPRDTLWIRYEDFNPAAIGRWFGRRLGLVQEAGAEAIPPLAELRKREPTMFGPGDYTIDPGYAARVWARHGSVMSMLGYRP